MRAAVSIVRPLLVVCAAAVLSGCATARLNDARDQFRRGNAAGAAQTLDHLDAKGKDRVLILMERGTVRQAAGQYEQSAADFIRAHEELEKMTTIQVGQDTTSLVINDNVQDFRGAPYERTMIHVFAAMSHLAVGAFENAAVEARRIIQSLTPEAKGDYPDDAFSHYMAGFCLQMMDDPSNASLQYRKAAELAPAVSLDDRTGRIGSREAPPGRESWPAELVCFVLAGQGLRGGDPRTRAWQVSRPLHGEIVIRGDSAGRSFTLSDTTDLAFTTEQKEAARRMVKTAARIAIKESIAHSLDKDNDGLGELVRFILIGLFEQPDLRRWETLPRWLQVARVPCPPDLSEFEVVFRNPDGVEIRRKTVAVPLSRKRDTFVSVVRDIP